MNTETGTIKPMDALTEEEKSSGDWVEVPKELNEDAMAVRKSGQPVDIKGNSKFNVINIKLRTDKNTKDVSIEVKSECTISELQVAVGYLMAGLAVETSIEVLEGMVKELKNG